MSKDEQFSNEKEVRGLMMWRFDDKITKRTNRTDSTEKTDEDDPPQPAVKLAERSLPTIGKLYCKSPAILFDKSSEIIIGLKVANPVEPLWNLRCQLMRHGLNNAQVCRSKIHYR